MSSTTRGEWLREPIQLAGGRGIARESAPAASMRFAGGASSTDAIKAALATQMLLRLPGSTIGQRECVVRGKVEADAHCLEVSISEDALPEGLFDIEFGVFDADGVLWPIMGIEERIDWDDETGDEFHVFEIALFDLAGRDLPKHFANQRLQQFVNVMVTDEVTRTCRIGIVMLDS